MDAGGLNPIKLSKDWSILLKLAIDAKLSSRQPRVVFQFVEDHVNAPLAKKAEVLTALLEHLSARECLDGNKPIIVDLHSSRNGGS